MVYDLFVSPEAEREISVAYEWYEEQQAGLGREILLSVNDALERIQRNPLAFTQSYREVRQSLIKRFPYVTCYIFDGKSIHVLAVLHGHRDPNEWQKRLG
jgi:plasmid stabilization system protein ParE